MLTATNILPKSSTSVAILKIKNKNVVDAFSGSKKPSSVFTVERVCLDIVVAILLGTKFNHKGVGVVFVHLFVFVFCPSSAFLVLSQEREEWPTLASSGELSGPPLMLTM